MAIFTGKRDGPGPSAAARAGFEREQRQGLALALKGRLAVLAVIALSFAFTRQPPNVYYMEGLVLVFALLGVAQLWVVVRFGVGAWPLYIFTAAEVSVLVVAIVLYAAPFTRDLPVTLAFRFDSFIFFFLFIASAAFSYAPGLVLWSGLSIAAAWGLGSLWVVSTQSTLSWDDIPDEAGAETYMAIFLDPTFFGVGSRLQEAMVVLSVAGLLAVVAWRARRLVFRQVEVERQRRLAVETFGKYVPEAIASQLIRDEGALEPQERTATVMFTDIEGFTRIAEPMAPAEVLPMLDEYFEVLGQIIAEEGGMVGQFQGDALIATFNVPVAQADHAAAALRAALKIQAAMAERRIRGQQLRTRIGLNTGPIVSGSVGSRGRRSYTVYGDVVNAAARIEAMNKEFSTTLLVAGSTAAAAGDGFAFRQIGELTIRGRSEPTALFEVVG